MEETIGVILVIIIMSILGFGLFFWRWCPPIVRARGKFAQFMWQLKWGIIFGIILSVAYFVLVKTGIVDLEKLFR